MKTILIIDDDETILEVVRIILEDAGYQVMSSSSGDIIDRLTMLPDLIFLDVLLSGEDGVEICKKIKVTKILKHIPVVMLSAHSSAGKVSEACGADDFLPKPFDIDVLVGKVKEYIH